MSGCSCSSGKSSFALIYAMTSIDSACSMIFLMAYKILDPDLLTTNEINNLLTSSEVILKQLITTGGIYASTSQGANGVYHAWFGRDSAITTLLLIDSMGLGGSAAYVKRALVALEALSNWQGANNNPLNGEEAGKIPHEIRHIAPENMQAHRLLHKASTNTKPWYVQPETDTLINWDSCDSTPLWIRAMLQGHAALNKTLNENVQNRLRHALDWCMRTIDNYDGLVGFTSAAEQVGRVYSGLENQGWKDTTYIYQDADGKLLPYPIKDLLVNAEIWLALFLGAKYFSKIDEMFSTTLSDYADSLKQKINSEDGFRLAVDNGVIYAEAISGNGHKLKRKCIDHAALLWARTAKESLLADVESDQIVSSVLQKDMFNPSIGMRNYARGTLFPKGTNYHGSPQTYWPFMSSLVAAGFLNAGYEAEARKLSRAMVNAVKIFGTNIEMFIEVNNGVQHWQHPVIKSHRSASEQAWTAAGLYFCAHLLLRGN